MRETKVDRATPKRRSKTEQAIEPQVRGVPIEPFEAGAAAKALVEGAHVTRRRANHLGAKHKNYPAPSTADVAAAARDEQVVLGDHQVTDPRRKVAQLNAHPEISGSFAGVGVGDIVDRLHEGLDTANTLIRSFDLCDERFARAEFGPAPSISEARVHQIADKELARLFELGEEQVKLDLRKADHHPLVKDRALFALGRAAVISGDGGEAWLALKYLPAPGAEPELITVHASLAGGDFKKKKDAIETLGINLLHAAYFHQPGELQQALLEGLPPGIAALDFIRSPDVALGEPPPVLDWPEMGPPHSDVGADRRALHKAQQLKDSGKAAGVVAEIGASQLVAELFRRARGSDETLIERKSNYGMEMSALAYGKTARAVSKERLEAMLDHEFAQFSARAKEAGLDGKNLFAYANTVATKSGGEGAGWLGIDFQTVPGGPTNRIVLHARMLSSTVPEQELALKTLGINLIHATQLRLDPNSDMRAFLAALTDGIPSGSLSLDHIEHRGSDLTTWSDDSMRIELLQSGRCECLLFAGDGQRTTTLDHFYKREYRVCSGRETNGANLVHLDLRAFEKHGCVDEGRLLARIAHLNGEGRDVILTRRPELRDLIEILSTSANTKQAIVVSRAEMRRLLDPKQWIKVEGGMSAVLGRLSSDSLQLQVMASGDPIEPKSASGKRMLEVLRSRGVVVDLEAHAS